MAFTTPLSVLTEVTLREGFVVLDIGAGSGEIAREASRIVGPSGKVFALDVQQPLLERLKAIAVREGLANIEVVWADAEKERGSKLADSSVDAAILSNVLFQAERKEGMAAEAVRVLRKGGKLIVIEWGDSFGGIGPAPDHVFDKVRALALFSKYPLTLLKEFAPGEHHYGLLYQKN